MLRFSVSTPNIGTGDLALGDPNVHVANNDRLYEFAQCPLRVGLDLGALDDHPEDGRIHRDAPPKIEPSAGASEVESFVAPHPEIETRRSLAFASDPRCQRRSRTSASA